MRPAHATQQSTLDGSKKTPFSPPRNNAEGKIGNIKNDFIGGILRVKGSEYRAAALNWAVLAHNLRTIARLPHKQTAEREFIEDEGELMAALAKAKSAKPPHPTRSRVY